MSILKVILTVCFLGIVIPERVAGRELVDLEEAMPGILVDLRYASAKNIVGRPIYRDGRARLRPQAVTRLKMVQEKLRRSGLQLIIWDAYRPPWAQEELWKAFPNPQFVAPPKPGSRHSRGTSVDVGLADLSGRPVEVPTDHDVFSPLADHDFSDLPKGARQHAEKLRRAMFDSGWSGVPDEWWHYDLRNWREYSMIKQTKPN